MKKYTLHLSLAVIAAVLGALAVSFVGFSSQPVGVVRAAQAQNTPTAIPTSGRASPTATPTLTWTTPSNSDPTGNPGETVTLSGADFDVSAGAISLQLALQPGAGVSCPTLAPSAPTTTEVTAAFQVSFTVDAAAASGARYAVCAYPGVQGAVIHSKALAILAPSLCADTVCTSSGTDNVPQGQRTITVTGKDWQPVGGHVTVTLCCDASATATPTATPPATATRAPQAQPTHTPIILPTINVTPPIGKTFAEGVSAAHPFVSAPITQTVAITPCADNPAHGCFTLSTPLPANAHAGATYTLTAQAQGNTVVAHGPQVKIVAPPATPGGLVGTLSALGADVPELFLAILLLLLVMVGMLVWLATRRESGVGRQF